MFSRALASAKIDCPEGKEYNCFISLIFRRVFPVTERGGFLFVEGFWRLPHQDCGSLVIAG